MTLDSNTQNDNTETSSDLDQRLQELATGGLGCKAHEHRQGNEKRARKSKFIPDPTVTVGNITYRFYSNAHSVLGSLRTQHPKQGIDVLVHGHNCINVRKDMFKFLSGRVPGLTEADMESGKSNKKLGTFRGVRYTTEAGKVGFVASLYVQRGFGTRGEGYKPPYKDKYHIDPSHVRQGLTALVHSFRNKRIGLVMFGDDTYFPTPWSIIEKEIETVCAKTKTEITIFIPIFMLTQERQELSDRLKEAARSVGYSFV